MFLFVSSRTELLGSFLISAALTLVLLYACAG
jgi:hypothetical protein